MDTTSDSFSTGDAMPQSPERSSCFPTTKWSVVLDAADLDPSRAQTALEKLCSRYWYPVYAFVRQKERDVHRSQDLTQSFFCFVIEQQALRRVERNKGRFRSFVLASLTNFLHNEHDKQQAQKRGGRYPTISLDEKFAEDTYRIELADQVTPEKLFERTWATVLVRRVLDSLRDEYELRGKAALFAGLQPYLTGEPKGEDYALLTRQLDMEAGALKVALHRMRRRFGELLRREVAYTVTSPEEIEVELRQLLAAIGS